MLSFYSCQPKIFIHYGRWLFSGICSELYIRWNVGWAKPICLLLSHFRIVANRRVSAELFNSWDTIHNKWISTTITAITTATTITHRLLKRQFFTLEPAKVLYWTICTPQYRLVGLSENLIVQQNKNCTKSNTYPNNPWLVSAAVFPTSILKTS